jgi:hypothetical protein
VQHELSRLYPDVWRSFLRLRSEVMDSIFEPLFAKAERRGLLRPGINRAVMQAYLLNAYMDTLQEPAVFHLKTSQEEILQTIKTIYLNGSLRNQR